MMLGARITKVILMMRKIITSGMKEFREEIFMAKTDTICWACTVDRHDQCKRKKTKKRYDCTCFTCFGDNL